MIDDDQEIRCPVCGYDGLSYGPLRHGTDSFEICPSCGFEFGFSDGVKGETYELHRQKWIDAGCRWWSRSRKAPPNWDPVAQLVSLGTDYSYSRHDDEK